MFIIMKSIERDLSLVGTSEFEEEANILMQKDFAWEFRKEFNGLEPTEENLEEYASDAELNLEAGTAFITGSQNYDWKRVEEPSPYFAQKRWCREDICGCLLERGYSGFDWEIDKVLQEKGLKHLADCTDEDWETIHQVMDDAGFQEQTEHEPEDDQFYEIAEDFMGEFNPVLWDGQGRMPLSVIDSNHKTYDFGQENANKLYLQFEHDTTDGWIITCILCDENTKTTKDIMSCMEINSISALAHTIKELLGNSEEE